MKSKKNKNKRNKQPKGLDMWHWPYLRTNFGGAREYECPHGVGHGGIHGCDGCCYDPSFFKPETP